VLNQRHRSIDHHGWAIVHVDGVPAADDLQQQGCKIPKLRSLALRYPAQDKSWRKKESGQSLGGLEQGGVPREESEGKRKVMQASAARVLLFSILFLKNKKMKKSCIIVLAGQPTGWPAKHDYNRIIIRLTRLWPEPDYNKPKLIFFIPSLRIVSNIAKLTHIHNN
jgi:hypothetical protein